jgi:RHS repeat-associated protein
MNTWKRWISRALSVVVVLSMMATSAGFAAVQPAAAAEPDSGQTLDFYLPVRWKEQEGETPPFSIYLPVVMRAFDASSANLSLEAGRDNIVYAPDGTGFKVLSDTLASDGYFLYTPVVPSSAPPGKQASSLGFELLAFSDSVPLREFDKPVVGRIPYTESDFSGAYEDSLAVYVLDEQVEQWQILPSEVDLHRHQVVFTTTHLSTFGVMARPLATNSECDTAEVGRGASQAVKDSMCTAFIRAGGIEAMGVAQSDDNGTVHPWGDTQVQDFTGGTLDSPILIYRNDTGSSYYMERSFVTAYYDAGGPGGYIGLPRTDPRDEGPEWYVDESSDFRDGPIMYFEYGFIAYDKNWDRMEAHRNFPLIENAVWDTSWVNTGETDADGNWLYEFTVRATIEEADANPGGKPGDEPELSAGFGVRTEDGEVDYLDFSLSIGETGEFTFPELYTQTQSYQFYFNVWRSSPDYLNGYYPCNWAYADPPEDGWFKAWTYNSEMVYELDCKDGGGGWGGDFTPPVIDIANLFKDGRGSMDVQARITDNSGSIASAQMSVDAGSAGQVGESLELYPDAGPNMYDGVIVDIPSADVVQFAIQASDPSGNTTQAHADSDGNVWYSHMIGSGCASSCGNPVNSSLGGKTETAQDLVIPGRSGTPIVVQRVYQSQTDYVGPFGKGWSFTYDYALETVTNRLLDGVHIRYPDGHTVNYEHDGNGQYNSVSPGSYEYLLKDGSGYTLHLPDQTVYHFDGDGRLARIVNAKGGEITLSYSGGHLNTVTNASNRTVVFDFTGDRITSITSASKTLHYEYEGDQLRKAIDAEDGEWVYEYDANDFLSRIQTPEGHTKNTQTYNDRGEVQEQTVGNSRSLDFDFDQENDTMAVSDIWGNTTTHTHDSQYRLVAAESALGYTETFKYDDDDNLIAYTDQAGNTWRYGYDANGNMIYRADSVDGTSYEGVDETRWLYDDENNVISMTNSLRYTTRYAYDEQGNRIHTYFPDGGVITNTYTSDGQIKTRTDQNGHTTTYEYYPDTGDLWKVIDPLGNTTTYEYDELGRKTAEIDANGNRTEFRYNGRDQLIERIDPYGNSTRYRYDDDGRLTDEWDRNGAHTQYEYSECCGLLTKKIDAEGGVTEYGYNEMNLRVWMRDPNGNQTDYVYDEDYNLIEEIGPAPTPGADRPHTYYFYDARGNKVREIDPAGNVTHYTYDANNRLKYERDAEGNVTEYCYDTEDQLVTTFDPRRAETRLVYDAMGRRIATIDALGKPFTYTYNLAGQLVATVTPYDALAGDFYTTTYKYDPAGRRVAVVDPLGNATRYGYDGVGNTVVITDANGNVTRREYDKNNRLIAVTDALSGTVRYGYDAEGHRTLVTDTMGCVTRYGYDLLGRTVVMTDPLGYVTRYGYDANGNQISVTNALTGTTLYGYDAFDRLIWERDPLGYTTNYGYDAIGNRTVITDAEGNVTFYGYDGLGNLISVTDAHSSTTLYGYDEVGNRTVITYANGTTSHFTFNLLNQLVLEVDEMDQSWRYSYNDAGMLIRKVDAEWQATYYQYDGAGRLTATRYGVNGDEGGIAFEYDAVGNQTAMHDSLGTLTTAYDALNRPVTVTDYMSRTLVYGWNPDGTRASLTYPDGRVLTYTYNDARRLDTLTLPGGQTADYTYNPLGYQTQVLYSNGTQADYVYDAANRLTELRNTAPGGEPIAWYAYEMDKMGNRTVITEQRPLAPDAPVSTIVRRYTYDELYRLTRSTSTVSQTHEMNWELDSVGNWERRYGMPEDATEPLSDTYSHNGINALVQAGDWLYEYDRNGSRIAAYAPLSATQYASLTPTFGLSATLVISYNYNYENRLTAVHEAIRYPYNPLGGTMVISSASHLSPTMKARYVYDGLGRRVEKWVTRVISTGGVLTVPEVLHRFYVYDGLDVVAEYEELDGLLSSTTHYYHSNGRLVALEREVVSNTVELLWYHFDGLGSVVGLSNQSDSLFAIYSYGEYGQILRGDISWNCYTYTGQEWDRETKLYHFYARYYGAINGAWLTQDVYRGSISNPLSLYRMLYVGNNPINKTDLYGWCEDENGDCSIKLNPYWSDLDTGQAIPPGGVNTMSSGRYWHGQIEGYLGVTEVSFSNATVKGKSIRVDTPFRTDHGYIVGEIRPHTQVGQNSTYFNNRIAALRAGYPSTTFSPANFAQLEGTLVRGRGGTASMLYYNSSEPGMLYYQPGYELFPGKFVAANSTGGYLIRGGSTVLLVYGIYRTGNDICTSAQQDYQKYGTYFGPNAGQAVTRQGFGWGGSIGGFLVCEAVASTVPIAGTVAGLFVCSAVGGYIGYTAGDRVGESVFSEPTGSRFSGSGRGSGGGGASRSW